MLCDCDLIADIGAVVGDGPLCVDIEPGRPGDVSGSSSYTEHVVFFRVMYIRKELRLSSTVLCFLQPTL